MKDQSSTPHAVSNSGPHSAFARLDWAGDTGVLILDRPPNNALNAQFCTEISAMVSHVLGQDRAAGLVICSDLAGFSSGADVADLISPVPQSHAALADLCRQIADAPKPVVAAVHGLCLSTGLDLALAAQGRVAGAQARFGFPDMRLGRLPSGGGIYRLTRLLGAKLAVDIILDSKAIPSEEALEIGLIDQLCAAGDEVTQAVAMVQDLRNSGSLQRRDYLANLRADMAAIADKRAKLPAQTGPWVAQHRLIECAEAALLLPPDMALAQEAATFDDVQRGPIARALAYAFVARSRTTAAQKKSLAGAQTGQISVQRFRNVMAQIVDHFQTQNMARQDILGALAEFGVGLPAGSAVPKCPSGAEDVVPALLAAWGNAGAHLLRTGAMQHSYEIDFAVVSAGMCPNWQGGPLYQADKMDAAARKRDLARRAQAADPRHAPLFAPDPLWDDLIADGLSLSQYQA